MRVGLALRATLGWGRVELTLGTTPAERHWIAFWDMVRAARRGYARAITLLGAVAGAFVGLCVATVDRHPAHEWWLVVPAYLSVVLFARGWGAVLRATVAPFLVRSGQRMARLGYIVAHLLMLALGPVLPGGIGWAAAAGVLVWLPWVASAVLETRRHVPAYPAPWRDPSVA